MEPTRDARVTLVDLLDRVLDKGLVIQADVIISVAGVPLIGLNLRAALAGMETMLQYGMLTGWDEQIRGLERARVASSEPRLLESEKMILASFGSYWAAQGIYTAWRSGSLYLTDRRLLIWNRAYKELILEVPLTSVQAMELKVQDGPASAHEAKELLLLVEGDQVARIRCAQIQQLKIALEERTRLAGLSLKVQAALLQGNGGSPKFLRPSEVVGCRGKIWYWAPHQAPGREKAHTWRPGILYLTNQRLCWWNEFDQRIGLEVPIRQLVAATVESQQRAILFKEEEQVLDLIYQSGADRKVGSFSGREVLQWHQALAHVISQSGLLESQAEPCPQCGEAQSAKVLLEQGCQRCGWVSPRLKAKLAQTAE